MTAANGVQGKVAVVTGGSRGIGAAIAQRFSSLGYRVVIVYRSDQAAAEALTASLGPDAECLAVQADIARPEDIERLVANTVERFGAIDVLVNCAAIGPYRPLGKMDADFIRPILETNIMGTVLLTQAALPHMSDGGRIINFASALAYRPIPTSSVYSASKAAIVTLTHAFAKELGARKITVNAVAPGVIETDMTTQIIAERGEQIMAMTPLGRIGQTDDIAGIVAFLASPEAGWITGRTIIADGGVT
ncbi:MAG: 3-oxoacyl-ACP reductase FabG [Alphaproteobacteria bacterium]|nr:3-oxoacyl-ACP reductase FabG [Rhizobiaceae bacterium]MBU3963180.1 3-oxoacyl-ACP reductase FabG [Alphaproteobacteria bacterium]MBU4048782.1 3-oxoacyl-ACP reductase FabG [Alphaproteobacteria bacterium]MBU4088194.1 3-oxoacyl-ACP reductase FabG [Alphaproteobacteria bacterium]MBU4158865.1 3-oxoacyl-ACP reductase FabG [Alphaproteobacteria bacterium]